MEFLFFCSCLFIYINIYIYIYIFFFKKKILELFLLLFDIASKKQDIPMVSIKEMVEELLQKR